MCPLNEVQENWKPFRLLAERLFQAETLKVRNRCENVIVQMKDHAYFWSTQ